MVGCGVFGLSTLLELSRRFPESAILGLDAYAVPSPWSAANDYNKIIRAEYSDIEYSKLALELMKQWETDPVLSPYFVKSGRFTMSPSNSSNASRKLYEDKGVENLVKLGVSQKISILRNKASLVEISPAFKDSTLFDQENVEIKYNPDAGYGIAKDSLESVHRLALENGVVFRFGETGHIVKIDHESNIVHTKSGHRYKANKIIVCMGASTGYVVNLHNQINSTGLFVTHLQLTDLEYEKYKDIPIFFSAEHGYYFPPDSKTKKLKFAMTFCDSKNTVYNETTGEKSSLPRYRTSYPTDTFPTEGTKQVKRLLSWTLPELADHTLIDSKTCWISDSVDSDFLIDFVPKSTKMVIACGDSGHGYKFLGNIGKYIVDKLENKLNPTLDSKWKWRSEPSWPTDMKSRAKREHLEMNDIKDWYSPI